MLIRPLRRMQQHRMRTCLAACLGLLFFLCALPPVRAQAQFVYMNEWYHFNQNYIKLLVTVDGPYRVYKSELAAASVPNLATLDPDRLQVFYRGVEQPITVTKAPDGSLSYFEFEGRRNDGMLDTAIYYNPNGPFIQDKTQQPNIHRSFFTDTSAYFVTWDSAAARRRIDWQSGPAGTRPAVSSFRALVRTDYLNSYFEGGGGSTDPGHILNSEYITGEGYISNEFGTGDLPDAVARYVLLPGYLNTGPPPHMQARVLGATSTDQHITSITINGTEVHRDTTVGINISTRDFDLNLNMAGNALVRFLAYGQGNKPDRQHVCWQSIEYNRNGDMDDSTRLVVRQWADPDTARFVFTRVGLDTAAWLFDPANDLRIRGTVSGSTVEFLVPGASGPRDLYVYTDRALRQAIIRPRTELANLSNVNDGAEFIILTDPAFANSAQAYAAYRDTCSVNRLSTKIVYVDQVFDEFGYGSYNVRAIKNFFRYTLDHWAVKPKFVLLWGKGKGNPRVDDHQNYVPSWGKPASDFAFVSNFDPDVADYEPLIPIGRVCLYEDQEGLNYLDKVKEYEAMPYAAWMKEAVFLGGGKVYPEQTSIQSALTATYRAQWEGDPMGGKVFWYQNLSNGLVSNTDQPSHSYIDRGVGLIHFFGHSSTNIFDVDILDASRYVNYGKYPFMVAFGCYGGDFIQPGQSFGERFVLEPRRGSIGYLANSTAGFLGNLRDYGQIFYDQLLVAQSPRPIGEVIRSTIRYYEDNYNGNVNIYTANHCKQLNLQGDPSITLKIPTLPDLATTAPQIWFSSATLSAEDAQFTINIAIDNYGRSFSDSFVVNVSQRLADGTLITHPSVNVAPIRLLDTLSLTLQNTAGRRMAGLNTFTVTLDQLDSLTEYSEANNVIDKEIVIQGNAPAIVYPYEFAIIGTDTLPLVAATYVVTRSGAVNYSFELDTVPDFSSAFKLASPPVAGTSTRGEWKPPISYQSGKVYYWRVRRSDTYPVQWTTASFKYLPGQTGWSQSRPPQFFGDEVEGIALDSVTREWDFLRTSEQLHAYIHSAGLAGRPDYFLGSFFSDDTPPPGVLYTPINHRTLIPSVQNTFWGDWHFLSAPTPAEPHSLGDLVSAIQATRTGDYFLMATSQNPRFPDWQPQYVQALAQIGVRTQDIDALKDDDRAIILGRKGAAPGSAITIFHPNYQVNGQPPRHDLLTQLSGVLDSAVVKSPQIGPARAWSDYRYEWRAIEPNSLDQVDAAVFGLPADNQRTPVLTQLAEGTYSLAGVDAAQFPRLILEGHLADHYQPTAPQLDAWEVYYQPAPDLAADPNQNFVCPDTIEEGQIVQVQFALHNLTPYQADSVVVRFRFERADRSLRELGALIVPPVAPRGTALASYRFHSAAKGLQAGWGRLVVEVNPDQTRIEQHYFNNTFTQPVYIKTDKVGPVLDVTVDGKHLMDGDFVQPDPEITVLVNDDNRYLPVTVSDSTYFIWFGTERSYQFNEQLTIATDPRIEAVPGRLPENKGSLIFRPGRLADGEYTLTIQSRDFKGNPSGDKPYQVRMNVESEKAISEVVPYPNPFSSSTRFAYTLTGDEKPYVFQLHVYTISGRLIKVIDLLELGEVHFGYNLTEFSWDGRDEYGDLLANGVYVYKTLVKFKDRYGVKQRDEGLGEFFKNGYGKLVILR
jgi:hypothetical protein